MRIARPTSAYARDYLRIEKRGLDTNKLVPVIGGFCNNGTLPLSFRPHKLHGEWVGFWECHVGNDWLLAYVANDTEVILYHHKSTSIFLTRSTVLKNWSRTGSHADIFE